MFADLLRYSQIVKKMSFRASLLKERNCILYFIGPRAMVLMSFMWFEVLRYLLERISFVRSRIFFFSLARIPLVLRSALIGRPRYLKGALGWILVIWVFLCLKEGVLEVVAV